MCRQIEEVSQMISKAKTIAEYLASLPADRREAIEAVRAVLLKSLDKDYEEGMQYGVIGYYVPHRIYPPGYHCDPRQPLPFASIASQKNHMAVYLMCLYGSTTEDAWFRKEWAKTGKKLDMGKCCVRFRKLEDLPLELIGRAVARVPAKDYIALYERMRDGTHRKPAAARSRSGSSPAKKSSPKRATRRRAAAAR